MTQEQNKILDKLEALMSSASNDMEASALDASNGLYDVLSDLIPSLKKMNDGTIVNSVENLKLIQGFKKEIDTYLNGDYSKSVSNYLAEYAKTAKIIDEYFVSILDDYSRNAEVYNQIAKSNVFTTVDSLLGAGIDANFKMPLIEGIMKQISSGTSVKQLKEYLKLELIDKPELKRYISQVSSDAIRQYNRQYMQAVTDDLGLKHYLYRGTAISDTREFCQTRHGKYYTEAEVKSWGNLGNWSGKIAGTNSTNIFVYLGGWNCRHQLIPVSKTIYDANVN